MKKYKGLPLLIIIYNNSCLGCTGRAIPSAYEFKQNNPSLQVIGIHSNFGNAEVSKEDIKSIFTSAEVPFPIYIDNNPYHRAFNPFASSLTPHTWSSCILWLMTFYPFGEPSQ